MSFPSLRTIATRPLVAIIGLLSLVLALSACSAIRLGYNALPELAYWWLDGFVGFEDTQREPVREDIARIHAWHRAEELPQYIELLQRMERLAAGEFTAAQACAFEPALRERAAALMRRIEPAATAHALSLQPEQLEHLRRKYEQRNREFMREWVRLSPDDLLRKRMKEIVERAETVYGTVSEVQLAVLREHLRPSVYSPAVGLAERQRRQQDTLGVLRGLAGQAVPAEQARSAVHGLLARYLVSPDPAYRAYVAGLRQEACRVAAALHAAAAPAQREHVVRRLRGWQRDLGELSAAQ